VPVLVYSAHRKWKGQMHIAVYDRESCSTPAWVGHPGGGVFHHRITHWLELPAKEPRMPATMLHLSQTMGRLASQATLLAGVDPDRAAKFTRAAEKLADRLDGVPRSVMKSADKLRDTLKSMKDSLGSEHPDPGATAEQNARLSRKVIDIATRHCNEGLAVDLDV
jgi:hypothetical protein